jgi:hypothetical protein
LATKWLLAAKSEAIIMALKCIHLGTKTFADIIDLNLLCADKAKVIYYLAKCQNTESFLSRHRRFGKSLLLRTITDLFTDNRELFKGLWIGKSGYASPKHPIANISLAMNG